MILCKIDETANRLGYGKNIDLLLKTMAMRREELAQAGRLELDGRQAYLVPKQYDTKAPEEVPMEAHRKYADVMFLLEGSETVYIRPVQSLENSTCEYDPQKDVLLAQPDPHAEAVTLTPGDVLILFPEDAHAPGCHHGQARRVTKVIGKALLEV